MKTLEMIGAIFALLAAANLLGFMWVALVRAVWAVRRMPFGPNSRALARAETALRAAQEYSEHLHRERASAQGECTIAKDALEEACKELRADRAGPCDYVRMDGAQGFQCADCTEEQVESRAWLCWFKYFHGRAKAALEG